MVLCEAIEQDQSGGISFRRIFDTVSPFGWPAMLQFAVSVQYRGGTGEHKHWLVVDAPDGNTSTTDESSFWLASTSSSHRVDSRFQIVTDARAEGRWKITAILDGRPVKEIPLVVNKPFGPSQPPVQLG
jgi:hypothetical protein